MKTKAYFFIIVLLLFSCANEGTLTGGIRPKPSLHLVSSVPKNGDTLVPRNSRVILTFSERLNKKSIENSIIFYPFFDRYIEYHLKKGKELEIIVDTLLKENFVHYITIKPSLKDIYGLPLAKTQTIVFSTGKKIYKKKIKGYVFNSDLLFQNNMNLYLFKDSLPIKSQKDIENIFLLKNIKDGFTTTSNGYFEFAYLPRGKYYILGLEDKNKNYKYDNGERIAYASRVVDLKDSVFINLLAKTQYNKIGINNAYSKHKYCVVLDITVTHDEFFNYINFIRFRDLDSNIIMRINYDTIVLFNNKYWLFSKDFGENRKNLEVFFIRDSSFITNIDTNKVAYQFIYPSYIDTSEILVNLKTKTNYINQYSCFYLTFSKPVLNFNKDKIKVIMFNDTSNSAIPYKEISLSFNIKKRGDQLILYPDIDISKDLTLLKFIIYPNAFFDYYGNSNKDTLQAVYPVVKRRELGDLTLYASNVNNIFTKHTLILYLTSLTSRNQVEIPIHNFKNGMLIKNIPDDYYNVKAFIDLNGNYQVDGGDIIKKQFFSEPILMGSDSLRIRAGWITTDTLKGL